MKDQTRLKPDDEEPLERALANVPWYALLIPFLLAIGGAVMVIVIAQIERP